MAENARLVFEPGYATLLFGVETAPQPAMTRQTRPPKNETADRVLRILTVVLVVGLLCLAALRARRGLRGPNYCPIDGHVAEWTKRRGQNLCDYGHFSNIEQAAHTWSAACP
jgi:hypothetical protein